MIDLLVEEPILLVFLVVGIGAGIGTVRVRGISIGPAAALFVGLAAGAIDDEISAAEGLALLRELGLVLFTYTVGLASGPTFVAAIKRGGASVLALVVGLVVVLGGVATLVAEIFGLTAAERTGIFAGSATSTPALQAAVDAVDDGDPVVAYSLAYPLAVVSMLVVLTVLLGRSFHLPAAIAPPDAPPPPEPLVNWTIEITAGGLPSVGDLRVEHPGIRCSRIAHDDAVTVATSDDVLVPGDAVVVVGPPEAVASFCAAVGRRSDRHLPLDRSSLDFRRVVVSNRRLAGRRVGELDLPGRYGVSVTRVRRGDVDLVADDDTALALGDRVRVVGPADAIAKVALELGDSERGLSEVDALGFAAGIAAGIALGAIDISLPGGIELALGAAGGPLLVGLVLGVVSRLGPVTFQIPHGANLVLRQIGILVFLAAAGVGSGSAFADAIGTRAGLELLLAGGIVAATFAVVVPLAFAVVLRRDLVATAGLFSGTETQPAALAYAVDRTHGDDRVNTAYALAFPIAMIAKILAVQFIV